MISSLTSDIFGDWCKQQSISIITIDHDLLQWTTFTNYLGRWVPRVLVGSSWCTISSPTVRLYGAKGLYHQTPLR